MQNKFLFTKFYLMQKIEKNNLKEFAQKKFGKSASDKLAEEICKIVNSKYRAENSPDEKLSGQTVRNWFSGRTTPVRKQYYDALAEIFPEANPHTFFIFSEYSK